MPDEVPMCTKHNRERVRLKRGAFWFVGCPDCVAEKGKSKKAAAGENGKEGEPAPKPKPKEGGSHWLDDYL